MNSLRTVLMQFNEDGQIDLGRIGQVRDISFLNLSGVGKATATIYVNGVNVPLAPGDPMLSFGGYENQFRTDIVNITFGAGTKDFLVFLNKVVD